MLTQRVNICKLMCQVKLLMFGLFGFSLATAQALTLQDAIDAAMKIDPTTRASQLNQLATKENISIARSRLLPQISLQGTSSQLTQTTSQDNLSGGSTTRSFAKANAINDGKVKK